MVDGQYVVRIRHRKENREAYRVWSKKDKLDSDNLQHDRAAKLRRNAQICERRFNGKTFAALAQDFDLSVNRVRDICVKQTRKEQNGHIQGL